MEAKDTVMNDEEISKKLKQETADGETYEEYASQLGIHLQDAINITRYGAILQAEISFKAGWDDGCRVGHNEAMKLCEGDKKAGIREVVKELYCNENITLAQLVSTDRWQAKLKEWNMKP